MFLSASSGLQIRGGNEDNSKIIFSSAVLEEKVIGVSVMRKL